MGFVDIKLPPPEDYLQNRPLQPLRVDFWWRARKYPVTTEDVWGLNPDSNTESSITGIWHLRSLRFSFSAGLPPSLLTGVPAKSCRRSAHPLHVSLSRPAGLGAHVTCVDEGYVRIARRIKRCCTSSHFPWRSREPAIDAPLERTGFFTHIRRTQHSKQTVSYNA